MKKSLWWACLWRVKAPCSLWWAPPVVMLSSGSLKVEQELCVPLKSGNTSLVLLWAWKSTNNGTCALMPFPYSFRRAIMGSAETLESSYSILSSNYVTNQSFIPHLSIEWHQMPDCYVSLEKKRYIYGLECWMEEGGETMKYDVFWVNIWAQVVARS